MKTTFLPGNLSRENAKAAMEDASSCSAVADTDTISEFLINAKKSNLLKTSR